MKNTIDSHELIGFICLPYGSILNLNDVIGFQWNPPPGDDLELPPGYIHFRNGETKSISAGDAWVLQDFLRENATTIKSSIDNGFERHTARVEEKKKKEAEKKKEEMKK